MSKVRTTLAGLDLVNWLLNEIELEAVDGANAVTTDNPSWWQRFQTLRKLAGGARAELLSVAQNRGGQNDGYLPLPDVFGKGGASC